MAKRAQVRSKALQGKGISKFLIILTVIMVLLGSYEAVTQNDVTKIAPTQLFLLAGVLGILGIYLKDEK